MSNDREPNKTHVCCFIIQFRETGSVQDRKRNSLPFVQSPKENGHFSCFLVGWSNLSYLSHATMSFLLLFLKMNVSFPKNYVLHGLPICYSNFFPGKYIKVSVYVDNSHSIDDPANIKHNIIHRFRETGSVQDRIRDSLPSVLSLKKMEENGRFFSARWSNLPYLSCNNVVYYYFYFNKSNF